METATIGGNELEEWSNPRFALEGTLNRPRRTPSPACGRGLG
jgi:hypothetical protein